MTELTPRNLFPYPTEREEPFNDSFKGGVLAEDSSHWAVAENGNLTFVDGGSFTFDAANDLVYWTAQIDISGFSTGYAAFIPGPRSLEIKDQEVVFFKMPRLIQNQNVEAELFRSNRIFLEGVRLHDLRLFVYRRGDTLYFPNGVSLRDGETGVLFGSGLGVITGTVPHSHATAVLLVPPAATTALNPLPPYIAPELKRVDVFKNGLLLIEGGGEDYTVDYGTGTINLTVAAGGADKYVVWRELQEFTALTTSHEHAVKLVITPGIPGTTLLNVLATSPALERVDVFRNGQLLVEGGGEDYTVDLTTGLVTLAVGSLGGDKFEIMREINI